MNNPFFSLVIPCHNAGRYLNKIFACLIRQEINKEDLQIILVDDASTDNSIEQMKKHPKELWVDIYQTDTDIHCPSNTRRVGLDKALGEWVCFMDQDDQYLDGALYQVREFIKSIGETRCVCTILQSYNEETEKKTLLYHKQAWLHGKFYNREFLQRNNINFKKDLVTHEDIYFNSLVYAAFRLENINEFCYYDIVTYNWFENPESITRSYEGERGYLHDNFGDYIISASDPFWKGAISGDDFCVNQILMTLLHCYFYYEAVSYKFGPKNYKDNVQDIKELIRDIMVRLNFSANDIIDYLYDDVQKYEAVRYDCIMSEGLFICKTSCKDFINHLINSF